MIERRLSMTVGRAVVGMVERAIRDACFNNGIETDFQRSHGFFAPDATLYVTMRGPDEGAMNRMIDWVCDPNTWAR